MADRDEPLHGRRSRQLQDLAQADVHRGSGRSRAAVARRLAQRDLDWLLQHVERHDDLGTLMRIAARRFGVDAALHLFRSAPAAARAGLDRAALTALLIEDGTPDDVRERAFEAFGARKGRDRAGERAVEGAAASGPLLA